MKSNKRLNWNDFGASQYNSNKDLKEMINKKVFKPSGQKGAGAFYTLN
jgi:hypothetical protein